MQGKTAERHTSAEFVGFLEQVVSGCKPHQEIHIILDNLCRHTRPTRSRLFLTRNSHVKLRTSCLPILPGSIKLRSGSHGWSARSSLVAVLTSVQDLSRKLLRYIRAYSKTARPFKWKYSDVPKENPLMLTNSLRRATSMNTANRRLFRIR